MDYIGGKFEMLATSFVHYFMKFYWNLLKVYNGESDNCGDD